MNAVLTVARREVITKLTDKAFVIGSLLLTAIIVGLLVVQSIVAGGVRDERLAATPDSVQLANTVAAQSASTSEELRITVVPVADEAAARAAIEADEVDSWLRKDGTGWWLAAKVLPVSQVVSAVGTAVRGPSADLPECVSGVGEGRARLQVEMDVRLRCAAAVAAQAERLPGLHRVSRLHLR